MQGEHDFYLYICEGCQGKDRLDSVLPNRAELGQWGEATGRQIEAPWKEEPSELLAQFTLECVASGGGEFQGTRKRPEAELCSGRAVTAGVKALEAD